MSAAPKLPAQPPPPSPPPPPPDPRRLVKLTKDLLARRARGEPLFEEVNQVEEPFLQLIKEALFAPTRKGPGLHPPLVQCAGVALASAVIEATVPIPLIPIPSVKTQIHHDPRQLAAADHVEETCAPLLSAALLGLHGQQQPQLKPACMKGWMALGRLLQFAAYRLHSLSPAAAVGETTSGKGHPGQDDPQLRPVEEIRGAITRLLRLHRRFRQLLESVVLKREGGSAFSAPSSSRSGSEEEVPPEEAMVNTFVDIPLKALHHWRVATFHLTWFGPQTTFIEKEVRATWALATQITECITRWGATTRATRAAVVGLNPSPRPPRPPRPSSSWPMGVPPRFRVVWSVVCILLDHQGQLVSYRTWLRWEAALAWDALQAPTEDDRSSLVIAEPPPLPLHVIAAAVTGGSGDGSGGRVSDATKEVVDAHAPPPLPPPRPLPTYPLEQAHGGGGGSNDEQASQGERITGGDDDAHHAARLAQSASEGIASLLSSAVDQLKKEGVVIEQDDHAKTTHANVVMVLTPVVSTLVQVLASMVTGGTRRGLLGPYGRPSPSSSPRYGVVQALLANNDWVLPIVKAMTKVAAFLWSSTTTTAVLFMETNGHYPPAQEGEGAAWPGPIMGGNSSSSDREQHHTYVEAIERAMVRLLNAFSMTSIPVTLALDLDGMVSSLVECPSQTERACLWWCEKTLLHFPTVSEELALMALTGGMEPASEPLDDSPDSTPPTHKNCHFALLDAYLDRLDQYSMRWVSPPPQIAHGVVAHHQQGGGEASSTSPVMAHVEEHMARLVRSICEPLRWHPTNPRANDPTKAPGVSTAIDDTVLESLKTTRSSSPLLGLPGRWLRSLLLAYAQCQHPATAALCWLSLHRALEADPTRLRPVLRNYIDALTMSRVAGDDWSAGATAAAAAAASPNNEPSRLGGTNHRVVEKEACHAPNHQDLKWIRLVRLCRERSISTLNAN